MSAKQPSIFRRLREMMWWLVRPLQRAWREVSQFASHAWPGAAFGSVVAVMAFMAYVGLDLRTGLGVAADVALCALVALLATAVLGLLIMLLATILRAWPRLFSGAFLGSIAFFIALFSFFDYGPALPLRLGGTLVLLFAAVGAGLAAVRAQTPLARRSQRIAGGVLLALALAAGVALFLWLASAGKDPYQADHQPVAGPSAPALEAPNPAEPGSYKVAQLFYGSGTDLRRPEYRTQVTLKTRSVDARPFVKQQLKDFKAKLRGWYWGFGGDQFPLNGRVWFPEGPGPFPLVLIVHGNHQMEEFSDPGYAYLGKMLASRGFILASVDQNFLNISWPGDLGGENDARGWMLLKHLELWREWNQTAGNPFYHKIDLSNIALIGHSRGGEALAHAAAFNRLPRYPDDARVEFNFNFALKSLIAIAPSDGQYEPANQRVPIENVNYLVFQGSHDADGSSFAGYRPYHRVRFTDGNYWMKAGLYIYRANHGQFNTVWGNDDLGSPFSHFLNQGALLDGEEQRRIACVYISAFLEATLRGKKEYIPLFRDPRVVAAWLPQTTYLSQFEDSSFRLVTNFDDSIDVTRTTIAGGTQAGENLAVWREQDLRGRWDDWEFQNKVLVVGWDSDEKESAANGETLVAAYSLTLPEGFARQERLDPTARLVFSVADTVEEPEKDEEDNMKAAEEEEEKKSKKKEPVDFTLELVADGATAQLPLSQFLPVQPVLEVKFTKWGYLENHWYNSPSESVFQTYELPLAAFAQVSPGFDPKKLKTIRFRFDRTKKRVILLDEIGFALEAER